MPGARGNRAEGQRRKRFRGAGQELVETDAGQRAPLLGMSRAQSRPRRLPFPRAALDTTGVRSSPRSLATAWRKRSDLMLAQPVFGKPTTTRAANPRPRRRGRRTVCGPADRPSQQRMPRMEHQHPTRRVPPGFGEERGVNHSADRRRMPIDPRVDERMRPDSNHNRPHRFSGAHRSVPASPRGLGTRSTASRSRAGSGCR